MDYVTSQADCESKQDEHKLLVELKPLLQKFIHDDSRLQLEALYGAQVFCHNAGFPKGKETQNKGTRFFVNADLTLLQNFALL